MKRPTHVVRNQLVLSLEREETHPLDEETRQAIIAALADLLLEAYREGPGAGNTGQGGAHEP